MNITRTYICGPISGFDYEERYARFEREEEQIFRSGEIPVNPMKNGVSDHNNWHAQMSVDLGLIRTCQKMVVLPFYKDSPGCREEIRLAEQLGMEIIILSEGREMKPAKKTYNPFEDD